MENIAVYCINMPTSTDRLARMQERFKVTGLTNINIVVAETPDTVEYYTAGMRDWYDNPYFKGKDQFRKDAACYASHMKAIKTFVQSKQKYCLICEDDVLFHNNFIPILTDIIENNPADLISLSYMLGGTMNNHEYIYRCPDKLQKSRVKKETWSVEDQVTIKEFTHQKYNIEQLKPISNSDDIYHGLWYIDPISTWGAQCYFISAQYAQQVLEEFDHSFLYLSENSELAMQMLINDTKITSEIVIRTSKGFKTSIPLVIEDCINSVRAPQDVPYHLRAFCRWNWNNYSKCDRDRLSPLAEMKATDAWIGYPYNISTDDIQIEEHQPKCGCILF